MITFARIASRSLAGLIGRLGLLTAGYALLGAPIATDRRLSAVFLAGVVYAFAVAAFIWTITDQCGPTVANWCRRLLPAGLERWSASGGVRRSQPDAAPTSAGPDGNRL